MLNVATLDTSDIQNKIDEGQLMIDHGRLQEITLSESVVAEVGSCLMSSLIGPKYQNLKATEKELNEIYGQIVVLAVQREKSQISAFATPWLFGDIKECLRRKITPEQSKLQNELAQIPVTHASHTRAVIEAGGLCSGILMPDETRTLLLRNVPDEWSDLDVEYELEEFGDIREVYRFPRRGNSYTSKPWGKVTFKEAYSAKDALDDYEGDIHLAPEGISKTTMTRNEFKIRLQWCRRPTKGLAFVTPRDPEDALLLSGHRLCINGSIVVVRLDRKDSTKLFIARLSSSTTEDEVERALNDIASIESVRMPRLNVGETEPEMHQAITGRLNMKIMEFAERDEFSVNVIKPKPANYDYIAYATFSNPETGLVAVNRLNGSLFDGKTLQAYPELRSSLHVQRDVYITLEEQLNQKIVELRGINKSVRINAKELRSGHFAINFEANDVNVLSSIRNTLNEMISGHQVGYASKDEERALFSPAGRDLLTRLQKSEYLRLLIRVDNRLRTVTMYGEEMDILEAEEEIQVFLLQFRKMKTREIPLKGEGRPPGLMKSLLLDHGLEMETLRRQTGVAMLTLSLQKHILTATGNDGCLVKLVQTISAAIQKLQENYALPQPDDVDCTVCFCPIEEKVYRLEDCGHPYCDECITGLIKSGLNDKQFPILCANEDCSQALVWKDFNNWMGQEQRMDLVKSSVESFVAQNPRRYKFCQSADCSMVYRVGYNEGSPYQCAGCGITICTKCHAQYHYGLSCAMYRSKLNTADYDLEEWVRKNPGIRALCPGCKAPIEKDGGCSHVQCAQCKIHMCWWCKRTFTSSGQTYDHQDSCNRIGTL